MVLRVLRMSDAFNASPQTCFSRKCSVNNNLNTLMIIFNVLLSISNVSFFP